MTVIISLLVQPFSECLLPRSSGYSTFVLGFKLLKDHRMTGVKKRNVEVEEKVKSLDAIKDAEVEITFEPPWSQDLMSEEAKLELGLL